MEATVSQILIVVIHDMKRALLLTLALVGLCQVASGESKSPWQLSMCVEAGYASSSSPFHGAWGVGIHRNLGYDFSLGIDSWLLIEKDDSEASYAISGRKGYRGFTLDASAGSSIVDFSVPLRVSDGPVREPLEEHAFFLRVGGGYDVSDKVTVGAYGRVNFSDREIFEHGYPVTRFGVVLRYSFQSVGPSDSPSLNGAVRLALVTAVADSHPDD